MHGPSINKIVKNHKPDSVYMRILSMHKVFMEHQLFELQHQQERDIRFRIIDLHERTDRRNHRCLLRAEIIRF